MDPKKMYSISCDDACGFMVKSSDKEEVVKHAMMHATEVHPDMTLTEEMAMGMVKES